MAYQWHDHDKVQYHCIFFLKELSHDCLDQPEEPFVTLRNLKGEQKGLCWISFLKAVRGESRFSCQY